MPEYDCPICGRPSLFPVHLDCKAIKQEQDEANAPDMPEDE